MNDEVAARDEIERLTQALRQALMNPFRRDAAEATLEAAEEAGLIRRVALAQSDAEPVAWQLVPKIPTEEMIEAHFAAHARAETVFAEVPEIWKAMLDVAPAPSRPDASAGLIEAAEIVKDWSRACSKDSEADLFDKLEKQLRARAGNRSGK